MSTENWFGRGPPTFATVFAAIRGRFMTIKTLEDIAKECEIPMRQAARDADMPPSTLQHHWKKTRVPLGILLRMIGVLKRRGADDLELWALVDPLDRQLAIVHVKLDRVPLITLIAAGKAREMWADQTEQWVTVPEDRKNGFALRVDGNSMSKTARDGEIILVDTNNASPEDGKRYVILVNGETDFRQFRANPDRFEKEPLIGDYPSLFCRDHEIQIIGRVWRVISDI